tara:strand:- start:103 stop:243 length:141 start_codon:yes stop_codon:yes gene_type:complete
VLLDLEVVLLPQDILPVVEVAVHIVRHQPLLLVLLVVMVVVEMEHH